MVTVGGGRRKAPPSGQRQGGGCHSSSGVAGPVGVFRIGRGNRMRSGTRAKHASHSKGKQCLTFLQEAGSSAAASSVCRSSRRQHQQQQEEDGEQRQHSCHQGGACSAAGPRVGATVSVPARRHSVLPAAHCRPGGWRALARQACPQRRSPPLAPLHAQHRRLSHTASQRDPTSCRQRLARVAQCDPSYHWVGVPMRSLQGVQAAVVLIISACGAQEGAAGLSTEFGSPVHRSRPSPRPCSCRVQRALSRTCELLSRGCPSVNFCTKSVRTSKSPEVPLRSAQQLSQPAQQGMQLHEVSDPPEDVHSCQ